jgi:sulfatase modifying factor 1
MRPGPRSGLRVRKRPCIPSPAIALSIAALLAVADVSADPRRRLVPPPPPAPPAAEARTGDGIAVLRAPGPDAVLIRAGSFTMGTAELEIAHILAICRAEPAREDCSEDKFASELWAHEVYLSDYWIDRTEVTVARYRQCAAAGRCAAPPFASGGARFDRPDYPVTLVNWNEARVFCAWAGGRLPTEAEWERAARGSVGRRYPWGNVYNPFLLNHGRFAWDDLDPSDGFLELAPVGSFPNGRTPEGVEDMAGNVEEWVSDYYAPEYPRTSAVNPKGPDAGDHRVLRGGSFAHGRPWVRGASRLFDLPGGRRPWRGFRCVRSA